MGVGDGLTTISTCSHLHLKDLYLSSLFLPFFFPFWVLRCVRASLVSVHRPPECLGSVVKAHGLNGPMAPEILALQPGIESSVFGRGRFLTIGPPEKSLELNSFLGEGAEARAEEPLSQKAP